MKVITNVQLNAKKLNEMLNKVLNEYNISVRVVPEESSGDRYVLNVYAELINPVKYSAYFSQVYDPQKVRTAEQLGEFLRKPKLKYGVSSKVLHWYHWAMLNDTLTYILDTLGVDYKIKSGVGTFRGWKEWREQLKHLVYKPELDPAFLKRVSEPVKSVYGIEIFRDRAKMMDSLGVIEVKMRAGSITPAAIEKLEEEILEATRASTLYEGVHSPSSLSDHKPRFRAWMKFKYGEKAEDMLHFMTQDEIDEEYGELEEFLDSVDTKNQLFWKFFEIWKKELEDDIDRAAFHYGYFEEELRDRDDAGFPLELAKRLLREPFRPSIDESELRRLLEKEVAEELETVSASS